MVVCCAVTLGEAVVHRGDMADMERIKAMPGAMTTVAHALLLHAVLCPVWRRRIFAEAARVGRILQQPGTGRCRIKSRLRMKGIGLTRLEKMLRLAESAAAWAGRGCQGCADQVPHDGCESGTSVSAVAERCSSCTPCFGSNFPFAPRRCALTAAPRTRHGHQRRTEFSCAWIAPASTDRWVCI